MSAINCRNGLVTVLQTIDGLAVLPAERRSMQSNANAVVSFATGTASYAGQIKTRTWTFAVRVVIPMQDLVKAETILIEYVDRVTDAILADLTLGGLANVTPAIAVGGEGDDGIYVVNGIDYRSIVLRVDIRDKL